MNEIDRESINVNTDNAINDSVVQPSEEELMGRYAKSDLEQNHPYAKLFDENEPDYYQKVAEKYADELTDLVSRFSKSVRLSNLMFKNDKEISSELLNSILDSTSEFLNTAKEFKDNSAEYTKENFEEKFQKCIAEPFNNLLNSVSDNIGNTDIAYISGKSNLMISYPYEVCTDFINRVNDTIPDNAFSKMISDIRKNGEIRKAEDKASELVFERIESAQKVGKKSDYYSSLKEIYTHSGREDEFYNLYFAEMAKDKEFCRYEINRAQELLRGESIGQVMISEDDIARDTSFKIKRIKDNAVIVAIGERFLYENNFKEYCENPKNKDYMKEFAQPNRAFRDETDIPEAVNEKRKKDAFELLVEEIKASVKAPKASELRGKSKKEIEIYLTDFAVKTNAKYSKEALHPEGAKKPTKEYLSVVNEGCDRSLVISNEDKKILMSEGSDEFVEMRKAYTDYLTASRDFYPDYFDELSKVTTKAFYYLTKKDTIPFTTSGKERVSAAVKIFTKSALLMLQNGESEGHSSPCYSQLRMEMLRNPECRMLVQEEIANNKDKYIGNDYAAMAFEFAAECDRVCRFDNIKDGILVSGKITTDSDTRNAMNAMKLQEQIKNIEWGAHIHTEEGAHQEYNLAGDIAVYNDLKAEQQAKAPKPKTEVKQTNANVIQ